MTIYIETKNPLTDSVEVIKTNIDRLPKFDVLQRVKVLTKDNKVGTIVSLYLTREYKNNAVITYSLYEVELDEDGLQTVEETELEFHEGENNGQKSV